LNFHSIAPPHSLCYAFPHTSKGSRHITALWFAKRAILVRLAIFHISIGLLVLKLLNLLLNIFIDSLLQLRSIAKKEQSLHENEERSQNESLD
jgi:hypothetical protein